MNTIDMEMQKRNDAVTMFIHDNASCYYGDVDINRGLRERLEAFVEKWGESPFWNFSYASKGLGLLMKKGVYEELCLWGMGSEIRLYSGDSGTIWWNYRMYDSRSIHADGQLPADALWHIDRRGLAHKVIDLFENMLTMFSAESELNNMVMNANLAASQKARK
jgi:hypothetical protein